MCTGQVSGCPASSSLSLEGRSLSHFCIKVKAHSHALCTSVDSHLQIQNGFEPQLWAGLLEMVRTKLFFLPPGADSQGADGH